MGDDQELIERYLRGEREAVGRIEEWISRAASPYRGRLPAEHDDLVGAVRLEVYQSLSRGRFRGGSKLKTFVWRVTNNTFIDALRRGARRGEEEVLEDHEWHLGRPSGQRRRAEDRELVEHLLAELSPDCVRLWGMVAEGRSYREMSREMGVSEGALRVRVHRCRQGALEIRDRLLGRGGGGAGSGASVR